MIGDSPNNTFRENTFTKNTLKHYQMHSKLYLKLGEKKHYQMHSKLYLKLGEKKKGMLNKIFKVSMGNSDQALRSKDPNALFIDEVRAINAQLDFG